MKINFCITYTISSTSTINNMTEVITSVVLWRRGKAICYYLGPRYINNISAYLVRHLKLFSLPLIIPMCMLCTLCACFFSCYANVRCFCLFQFFPQFPISYLCACIYLLASAIAMVTVGAYRFGQSVWIKTNFQFTTYSEHKPA